MLARALIFLWFFMPSVMADSQRPDAPLYGQPGDYAVGTQALRLTPDSEAAKTQKQQKQQKQLPLDITLWYPAVNPDNAANAYEYTLGLLRLPGHALPDALPDQSGAPYPLVVFSHGWGLSRLMYVGLMEHLASHGFIVMAVEHPGNNLLDISLNAAKAFEATPALFVTRPQDVTRVLNLADEMNTDSDMFGGMIDMTHVAAVGHSFGGYTALSAGGAQIDFSALDDWCDENAGSALDAHPEVAFYPPDNRDFNATAGVCFLREHRDTLAALRGLDTVPDGVWPSVGDARIKAVTALAPWAGPLFGNDGLSAVNIPTLVVVGSADQVTIPERDAFPIYAGISGDKMLFVLENANHFVYLDECAPVLRQFGQSFVCSDAVWDMQHAHALIYHTVTAFLREVLYADETAAEALTPDAMQFTDTHFERANE